MRSSCTSMILEAEPLYVDHPFLPHVDLRLKLQVPQGRTVTLVVPLLLLMILLGLAVKLPLA